jgi:oxalate decarboxylase/phosphoglucose isomerase-like protein (cupin superfamily)
MIDKAIFVDPDTVEIQKFDWGTLHWLSEPRVTQADRFSCGVVRLEPGKGHVRHNHPESEEILYFISGKGLQTVGDEERECHAGELVHIPQAVFHSTVNTGGDELVLFAVYAPYGPEALLRSMPECEIIPPKKSRSR